MSIVNFAVRKPVPVNLLMLVLILGGAFAGLSLRREFFPEVSPELASVSLIYPGATPEEIETSLAKKVEDKIAELDEVEKVTTTLGEGGGAILVEFRDGIRDVDKAVREVERVIDALRDLPEESERSTITEIEPQIPVIRMSLFGDVDEIVLKRSMRVMRDEIKTLPGMGEVQFNGVRGYEVRVEVNGPQLIKYGISLPEVTQAIRNWMQETPGGTVKTGGQNIRVRTMGVDERAPAIRQIVLRAGEGGSTLRVGDIAEVREAFVEDDIQQRQDGLPALSLTVFKSGKQDIINMADMIKAYVAGRNGEALALTLGERINGIRNWMAGAGVDGVDPILSARQRAYRLGANSPAPLPPGTHLVLLSDFSRYVQGRLDLLLKNAAWGGGLVFLTLVLFLNWRAAAWVGMGMITALLGTLLLMWLFDMSLNFMTMFGLIIVVGILVDDGIVVSENIQAWHERGVPALEAALGGTTQVLWPVVSTVLTNIVAFMPLTFVKGQIGDLMGALPMVVTFAMLMSLVEALLILPSHLGHSLANRDRLRKTARYHPIARFEKVRDDLLMKRFIPWYTRAVGFTLHYRYISTATALGILIITMGMVYGGRARFTFLPKTDAETVLVDVRLPIGSPLQKTSRIVADIELAAQAQPEIKSISSVLGQRANLDTGATESNSPHVAQLFLELSLVEDRNRTSSQVIADIRKSLEGKLDEVERIRFSELTGGPGDQDITIELRGPDERRLAEASDAARAMLANFAGVYDIADNNDLGQRELRVTLKPSAPPGFTAAGVSHQVRGALYGLDAHVFSEQQEDIDVRVRLDEKTRQSITAVQQLWIIGPDGGAVPLAEIAEVKDSQTYASIHRINRQRAVTVSADVDPRLSPESIVAGLPLDTLRQQFPDVEISMGGRQQQSADAFSSLPLGLAAALVMIYVLLAWLFNSLTQPFLVMLVIPFSIVGAVWGHLLLGYDLTFLSMLGYVALCGIVVNDSLVFVEFYNEETGRGLQPREALISAGQQRFRPIMLTTLTTVLGLMPMVLETSFQAKFLIPMAITISFGLMSSTMLVLIVLPCVLIIRDDVGKLVHWLWHGRPRDEAIQVEPA